MDAALQPAHAASRSRILRVALPIGLVVTALGVLWSLSEVPSADGTSGPPAPVAAMELPAVDVDATMAVDPCAEPAVRAALTAGDDAATVAAFGGGEAFRAAVTAGNAPCVSLNDPSRVWVVVNKMRPLEPVEYAPADLRGTALQTTSRSGEVRPVVADAVEAMAEAARKAGAGVLGVNNGYRSYGVQQTTYASNVRAHGASDADAGSARPGHSEHQTGLTLDVVACARVCGGIGAFPGTAQSAWVAAHSWEYGLIVRYEDGTAPTTGYMPEPWHLRYIGTELAAAYHAGGFHTLEQFFGLPAAPDYPH